MFYPCDCVRVTNKFMFYPLHYTLYFNFKISRNIPRIVISCPEKKLLHTNIYQNSSTIKNRNCTLCKLERAFVQNSILLFIYLFIYFLLNIKKYEFISSRKQIAQRERYYYYEKAIKVYEPTNR